MRFKSVLIILLLTSFICCREPDFIDFTYTQLLEETRSTGSSIEKIVIQPDTRHLEKYQFPQVCQLQDQLIEGTQSSGSVDHFSSIDDYLGTLKEEILNLLKLAETIKNVRSYLAEISKHLQLQDEIPVNHKFKSQLQALTQKQSQLSVSKQNIQRLTNQLNSKINQYNRNPKNEQFTLVGLNYDIENYNAKINYLQNLREQSIRQANAQPHTNFTDFFNRLGFDLRNETLQIQFIDKYFQNVSHINYLKDSARSLKDNIQVDRLDIDYKRSCQKEKQDIISKSSSHAEIKATLQHLRQKKKQFGSNSNKYCQGVARKLENQIKRLLKAINWTFTCAEGLDDLIKKRQQQLLRLQDIEDQINQYGAQGFDNYQRQYENTKNHIQSKFNQIKTFTIDQYNHDPVYLDQLIAQARRKKTESETLLKNFPQEMSSDTVFDDIKRLAEDIKKEKAKFCHEYGLYDIEQRRLWFLVFREEQNRVFAARMRQEYIAEGRKLQFLENQYKTRTQIIIKELGANYLKQ